jgi:hypothetical protein
MRRRLAEDEAGFAARLLRLVQARAGWLGAGMAAALAVVVAGVSLAPSEPPAEYRALAAAAPANADLVVIFRPETTERQMRQVLEASGARLVDGPTATDGYLLRAPPGGRDAALKTLRASGLTVLAEPLDAGGPR